MADLFRVTAAQINPTIGDIDGNLDRMLAAARQAQAEGAQLVVFPELALTGYYPGDVLDDWRFLARVDAGLARLAELSQLTPTVAWVVGTPTRRAASEGAGKRLYNSLLVVQNGRELLRYAKQLLPTYNIFDERRHFEPGPDVARVLRLGDARIGFLICEDGWNEPAPGGASAQPGQSPSPAVSADYAINPFDRMAAAAPDLVVMINASPSNIGKRDQRHRLFSAASRRHGLPLLYVNQIGGQDQLVFDGASFAVTPDQGLVWEAQRFAEDVVTLRVDAGGFAAADGSSLPRPAPAGLPVMDFYQQQIQLGLRDYARRCGFQSVVVGSSGGIDSALTLALAAQALGPEHVTAVTMPSRISSAGSVDDSVQLCQRLGIRLHTHPIASLVDQYQADFAQAFAAPVQGLTLENLQARVRGTVLMAYSNAFGPLLLTTGNKSELSVGYCTLYGDTNGGLGLIGDLYKTEVFALSRHLNAQAGTTLIPQPIIDKEPSAELAPGQRDVDSLPPYPVLDVILKHLIEGHRLGDDERAQVEHDYAALVADAGGQALVAKIRRMIARNEYKRRQAPPILRLRALAFGSGRQMPIAAKLDA